MRLVNIADESTNEKCKEKDKKEAASDSKNIMEFQQIGTYKHKKANALSGELSGEMFLSK